MYVVLEIYDCEVLRVIGPFSSKNEAKKYADVRFKAMLNKHRSEDSFNSCPYGYEIRRMTAVK